MLYIIFFPGRHQITNFLEYHVNENSVEITASLVPSLWCSWNILTHIIGTYTQAGQCRDSKPWHYKVEPTLSLCQSIDSVGTSLEIILLKSQFFQKIKTILLLFSLTVDLIGCYCVHPIWWYWESSWCSQTQTQNNRRWVHLYHVCQNYVVIRKIISISCQENKEYWWKFSVSK